MSAFFQEFAYLEERLACKVKARTKAAIHYGLVKLQ
jgi:hypothetical protein